MSKTVKVEASYKDELGKATNLTLTLILCIDDNKAPDFKKGGFGVLVDITDESKGVFDKRTGKTPRTKLPMPPRGTAT